MMNLLLKLSGMSWLWEKADGYKTIVGIIGKMLTGLGSMFIGSGSLILSAIACPDTSCVIEMAKGFSTNLNTIMITVGFYAFYSGLRDLGVWHKAEKSTTPPEAPPPGSVPAAGGVQSTKA